MEVLIPAQYPVKLFFKVLREIYIENIEYVDYH